MIYHDWGKIGSVVSKYSANFSPIGKINNRVCIGGLPQRPLTDMKKRTISLCWIFTVTHQPCHFPSLTATIQRSVIQFGAYWVLPSAQQRPNSAQLCHQIWFPLVPLNNQIPYHIICTTISKGTFLVGVWRQKSNPFLSYQSFLSYPIHSHPAFDCRPAPHLLCALP